MTELWENVVGIQNYEVSNHGRVRSWKNNRHGKAEKPKILKLSKTTRGYFKFCFSVKSKVITRKIHRLVLEAFVGPCPEGLECCHNDGDKTNNYLDNLRWDAPKNNRADKEKHGSIVNGENCWNSKIKTEDVLFIRSRYDWGTSIPIIWRSYYPHLGKQTVREVAKRVTWRHV